MSVYSRAELLEAISETKAAISAALQAQQYAINSGQGSQSATRASLDSLRKHLGYLQMELAEFDGDTGIVSLEVVR